MITSVNDIKTKNNRNSNNSTDNTGNTEQFNDGDNYTDLKFIRKLIGLLNIIYIII